MTRVQDARAAIATFMEGRPLADALFLVGEAILSIQREQAPELVPVFRKVDPALAMEWCLECPSCRRLVDELEGVEVVEVAWRWTSGEVDFDRRAVRFDYDQPGNFEGVAYRHTACGALVGLPDGWDEVAA